MTGMGKEYRVTSECPCRYCVPSGRKSKRKLKKRLHKLARAIGKRSVREEGY